MKKAFSLVVVLLFAVTTFSYADKKSKDIPDIIQHDEQTDEYYYEAVVAVPNVSKDVMFDRAKKWIIGNLKTGDNNVVADDKEFTIINSANFSLTPVRGFGWAITNGILNTKLKLYFKDGKYKIRCDNFSYHVIFMTGTMATPRDVTYSELNNNNKSNKHLKNETNEKITGLAQALENAIKSDAGTGTKGDW